MSKVFVIHQPAVRDRHTGEMRPQFDLSPALRFGQVVDVLPPGSVTQDYKQLAVEIRRRLQEEDFSPDDFILALGDPVAMVLGAMVASQLLPAKSRSASLKLLKWDRKMGGYVACCLPM